MASDLANQMRDLYKLIGFMIAFTILFVIVPLVIGAAGIALSEAKTNPQLSNYFNALMYLYEIITGVDIINAQVTTEVGKIIAAIFGLFNLIFIGFIAAIITSFLQLNLLRKKVLLPRRD
jgi:uncharacterized membrane protein